MFLAPIGATRAPCLSLYAPPHTGGLIHLSAPTARALDRAADIALQHGHHAEAERLAQLAATMREEGGR